MHPLKYGICLILLVVSSWAQAIEYQLDIKGTHAFIQFRIQHLGYSWLYGRFDRFDGHFNFDAKKPAAASADIEVDIASLNTNHAERDKHLLGPKFFDVKKYPKATFKSTGYTPNNDGSGVLTGLMTIKGITKPIAVEVVRIGGGPDPWGGVRQGFSGQAKISLADFGFMQNLGPSSREAELIIDLEGIKR
ncbi:Protein YceI [BD1-7 clade bacterium]|uniref:Protein YceI n=1 Tax=BD1-7 clade bacterium TaxID=2029982 RepID=A0A5S9QF90_9GAMM|nr:Protein YceI [BD1-7 clade bacterium]CAA0116138.1 Protein YceI [BD1-7 clade bacterium]